MRIHWNYGMMENAFYGCRIQKLTEKNFQVFISHLDSTPIMLTGKSVSLFRIVERGRSFEIPNRNSSFDSQDQPLFGFD